MILTEDRTYYLSLDIEGDSDTGLGNETVELTFTNKELLLAALTCNLPIQRLTGEYVGKRRMEILQKIFYIETALEEKGDHLKKSTQTMYLDSSEKSVISYYLGMFFTKLICKKLYGIDYLAQLSTIENASDNKFMDYFGGKWRSDMIGYKPETDEWSVWEAKGGSNRRAPALKMGCEQAGDIKSINGKSPEQAAVCMTYYDHGYLTALVKTAKSIEGEALQIEKEKFFTSYYKGIRQLFMEYGNTMNWEDGYVEITIDVPYFHNPEKNSEKRFIIVGMPELLFQKLVKEEYEEFEGMPLRIR